MSQIRTDSRYISEVLLAENIDLDYEMEFVYLILFTIYKNITSYMFF